MKNRKLFYTLAVALVFVNLFLGALLIQIKKSGELKVIFLDVGQGDAILISQGTDQVLIDGGKSGTVLLEKLGEFMPFWDRKIEMMIATHYDQDHIGGLIDIFANYEVSSVVAPGQEVKSKVYQAWRKALDEEEAEYITAQKDIKLIFPSGAKGKVLYPITDTDLVKNNNDSSVVLKLDYGKNSFLFTGDLPDTKEKELIQFKNDLSSKILKVGHHGSKHSTTLNFLSKVKPQIAVISVGADNSYGHPHQDVLDRLDKKDVRILRTDEDGSIEVVCRSEDELCDVFVN